MKVKIIKRRWATPDGEWAFRYVVFLDGHGEREFDTFEEARHFVEGLKDGK